MPQVQLASILRARAVAIDDGHVEAALRDPESGPALVEWTNSHLTGDTLLTLDEVELYDALQRSGRVEVLAAGRGRDGEVRPTMPLTDSELKAAIAALDRSTEAMRKQADLLRLQQDAVSRMATANRGETARATFETGRLKQWDADRSNLLAHVEQLSQDLDDRVGALAQQNKELALRVQQTVDSLCRSDDTLLLSLQKLGWALPTPAIGGNAGSDGARSQKDETEQQQQKSIGRLRDMCLHLIKLTVETVRTKLDRLYVEALEVVAQENASSKGSNSDANDADDADVATLQEELESLYLEILPVAQMSVEQQYLEPPLQALSGKSSKNTGLSLLALDYMDECLDFLVEHIALLAARINTATAHHATADALIGAARSELALPVPAARKKDDLQQRRLSNYGSPLRRRQSSGASSPVRTRSGTGGNAKANSHRRRSSDFGSRLANVPALDQLLESLSLLLPMQDEMSTPAADGSGGGGSNATLAALVNAQFLQSMLVERTAKADGVASNAQEAFEAAATAQLADARRAVWMARESVLAESPFGAVQLVDPEIDASINVIAQEVGQLRSRLDVASRGLDKARRGRSVKREQMVARWG